MASTPLHLPEDDARRVLLLQAFETGNTGNTAGKAPAWTADDAEWAGRVARASLGEDAQPTAYLAERARHAMQRLAPREATVRRLLAQRFPLGAWTLAALLAGAAAGVLVDQIGGTQRINLLAPPIWLLVLWNLLVYVAIVLQPLLPSASDGRLRRWLQRLWSPAAGKGPALQRFGALWAAATARLNGARAAWLLHLAAAALAAGVVAGLYLRGLVLDYRAGWQSTFLEAPAVHAVLSTLLAPAAALTGIGVPDVGTLALQQVQAGVPAAASAAPAAPWLHLYAATLALFVIGPRLLLAALAGLRLQRLGRRVPLPADDAYYRRLQRGARTQRADVWLLPHAAPPSAQAVLGLQALLAPLYRDGLHLQAADVLPYGQEEAHPIAPPAGTTLVAVLFDLGSTPEAEVQGQLLTRVASAAGLPLLVLVDETAFVRRFGSDASRRAERRAAWLAFVQPLGLPLLAADLSAPDEAAHAAARQALGD